jgi:uncharacterized damage-inducible protein DinB
MPEAWLSGPVPDVPPLLQPVAHALLQTRNELALLIPTIASEHLWERPHGVASIGFHLQHLRGVLDRLCTYARGEPLSAQQMAALKSEGTDDTGALTAADLFEAFSAQVDAAIVQFTQTPEAQLLDARAVGRAQLPSNVLGLLMHAAEHTTRHYGQLLVTARVV